MAAFRNIPNVLNDSEGDASIHLYSNIGPARPLPHNQYEKRIASILHSTSLTNSDDEVKDLNEAFQIFSDETLNSEYESDTTQVEQGEQWRGVTTMKTQKSASSKWRPRNQNATRAKLWNKKSMGFFLGFIVTTCWLLNHPTEFNPFDQHRVELEARIGSLESAVKTFMGEGVMTPKQLELEVNQASRRIDFLEDRLSGVGDFAADLKKVQESQIILDSIVASSDNKNSNMTSSEGDAISQLAIELESLKDDISNQVVRKLSEQKFITLLNPTGHRRFGSDESMGEPLTKTEEFLERSEDIIRSKENLQEKRRSAGPFGTAVKELERRNYAAHNEGARILGFLTKGGERKSISRKILLGWYDFFRSPENNQFGASSVLTEGETYWHCKSNVCPLGIRLAAPIVLKHILICWHGDRINHQERPISMKVFVKPRYPKQIQLIADHARHEIQDSVLRSPYLKKFIQVMLVELNTLSESSLIELPSFIFDHQIPIRDVYIELSSTNREIEIRTIKMFGLPQQDLEILSNKWDKLRHEAHHGGNSKDGPHVHYATQLGEDLLT